VKLLFLCTGNSCRSQMAEGFARVALPEAEVYSAGVSPTAIHPRAIAVMAEVGIDLGAHASKRPEQTPLAELDLLVTVCGHARESCPVLPLSVQRLHWPIEDPAQATGDEAAVLAVFRRVRDEIAGRVAKLARELKHR
jgi:arsenate reductase